MRCCTESRRPSFALIALGLVVAPVLGAQTPNATPALAVLTPGDSVHIEVWQQPTYSGYFIVGGDGKVVHPLYHDVQVGGVPLKTAETNLGNYLKQNVVKEPQFSFEPLLRVAVFGEVMRPVVFFGAPQTTIAEAVARAGGPNPNGDHHKIRVLRTEVGGARRQLVVDIDQPELGLASSPIYSGDQIVVPRARSVLRDVVIPAISVAGSIAALGLLIDRYAH